MAKNLIFLDIDGVLNCQLFYRKRSDPDFKWDEESGSYPLSELCPERISWLNQLCFDTRSVVVISSTWRHHGLDYCKNALTQRGATFEMIGVTPDLRKYGQSIVRGCEIYQWIIDNSEKHFGVAYYDFKNYAIIDDDSDMLLWQKDHYFQTDNYSGLTPTTCYKIKRFFTGKAFDK